jgi:hypothetical protein
LADPFSQATAVYPKWETSRVNVAPAVNEAVVTRNPIHAPVELPDVFAVLLVNAVIAKKVGVTPSSRMFSKHSSPVKFIVPVTVTVNLGGDFRYGSQTTVGVAQRLFQPISIVSAPMVADGTTLVTTLKYFVDVTVVAPFGNATVSVCVRPSASEPVMTAVLSEWSVAASP